MRRHRGTEDWRAVSTPFQFSSRSGRQPGVGGNLAVASSALGWRQRMGRGSVRGDYTSRKGSSAASPPDCDRKFERVIPTSRTPFGVSKNTPPGLLVLAQFGALPSLFPIERRKKDAEILRFGPSVGRGPIPRQHSDPARVFDLMLAKTGSIRPVPPEPHGLVADVDPALGQQILDIAQRQRISHVHHHNQTDDLWRAVDISERICSLRRLTQPGQPANLL